MSGAVLALLLLTAPAAGNQIETDECRADWSREGKVVRASWSSHYDVKIDAAGARIKPWATSKKLIKDVTRLEVREPTAERARLFIQQKPLTIFAKKREILLDARYAATGGGAKLSWKIIKGNSTNRFSKSWSLKGVEGGTRVFVEFELELPIEPPDWILRGQIRKLLLEDVERVRKVLGATRASREPPRGSLP
jgi:hypothetical protein